MWEFREKTGNRYTHINIGEAVVVLVCIHINLNIPYTLFSGILVLQVFHLVKERLGFFHITDKSAHGTYIFR